MGKRQNLKVFFLHNVIAPYRLPVFEEVGRQVDLEVFFCKVKTADRKWDTSLDAYAFKRRVLASFQLGPFFVNPGLVWRLLRKRYDVYLVGDFPETAFATFLTIAFAKLYRKPVVLWSETVDHEVNYFQHLATSQKPHHRLIRSVFTSLITGYRRWLLRLPDRYVALSGLAKAFLLSEGVAEDKISSGIQVMPKELLDEPTVSKAKGPYAGKKVILYLGYLNPAKGINDLITAFKELPGKDLRLVIAGSGPAEVSLHRLAKDDERIEFPGYVGPRDRANYYHWAEVMVLPTLVDCWAMVVNEALCYKTPVVVTDVAGAAELISQSGAGRIVPPRDPLALRAALADIMGDGGLRRQMSMHAGEASIRATDSHVGAKPIMDSLLKAEGRS